MFGCCLGGVRGHIFGPDAEYRLELDFGYRWKINLEGSEDLYRTQVNLGAGPKLFGGTLFYAPGAGEEKFFDVVVSNVMVQDLFSIIDQTHFSSEYAEGVQKLQGTASLCCYVSLSQIDPLLLGKTFHFIERDVGVDGDDAVGMIDFMATDPKAGISPPGKYLVQAYIICTPKEANDPKMREMLRQLIDKNLGILIPDYKEKMEWALYPVIWHLDGVAKTINNIKPSINTDLKNLFLIGDCVKAPGIGVNCAINSARILCDLVSENN